MGKILRAFHRVPTAGWIILAFVLRAGWSLRQGNVVAPSVFTDQGGYLEFAQSVLHWGVLGMGGEPSAVRSPLYPLFIAGCYAVFGENPLAVRLAQALLGAFSVLGLYLLAKELFEEKAARLAAAISAIYPFYIFYSAFLLTETLLIFLSVWAMHTFVSLKTKSDVYRGLLSGTLWGLLILTKPTALPCVLALQILAATAFRRWWRLSFKTTAAMVLSFWILNAPWLARNHRLLGQATWDSHGGITIYTGIVEYAANKSGAGVNVVYAGPLWGEIKDLPEIEQDSRLKKEALEFIRRHPARYFRQVFLNTVDFWRFFPRRENEYSKGASALTWVSLIFEAPLILLGFFAVYRFRRRWRDFLPLYLFIGNLFAVHALIIAQMRYRLPVMGFMIVLAVGVLSSFRKQVPAP